MLTHDYVLQVSGRNGSACDCSYVNSLRLLGGELKKKEKTDEEVKRRKWERERERVIDSLPPKENQTQIREV